MSLKREADPSFIKPDPGKRVKREGGDGNFSLYSIPMAPQAATTSAASSAITPKIEGGDRKPLAPAPNFGGGNPANKRKRKFVGNSIKARRGDDLVSAHFDRKTMSVEFVMQSTLGKNWSSVEVEQEIFERLNNAKFDIQPSENWGFLDRNCVAKTKFSAPQAQTCPFTWVYRVHVHSMNAEKAENSSSYVKKEERKRKS